MEELKTGIFKEISLEISDSDTARTYGSGLLDVFATPAMISLMERASMELVQPYLEKGFGTVGSKIDINHIKATPTGRMVRCISTLVGVEKRRLQFEVKVYENEQIVGSGVHERYIIEERRFIENLKKL